MKYTFDIRFQDVKHLVIR